MAGAVGDGAAAAFGAGAGLHADGRTGRTESSQPFPADLHRDWVGTHIPTAADIVGDRTPGAEDKRHLQCSYCGRWGHEQFECPTLFGQTMRRAMPGFDLGGRKIPSAWIGPGQTCISVETARAWLALQEQGICNVPRTAHRAAAVDARRQPAPESHRPEWAGARGPGRTVVQAAQVAQVAAVTAVSVAAPWAAEAAEAEAVAVPVSETDPRVRQLPIVQAIPYVEPARPTRPAAPGQQSSACPPPAAGSQSSLSAAAGWTPGSGQPGLGSRHSSAFSPSQVRQETPDRPARRSGADDDLGVLAPVRSGPLQDGTESGVGPGARPGEPGSAEHGTAALGGAHSGSVSGCVSSCAAAYVKSEDAGGGCDGAAACGVGDGRMAPVAIRPGASLASGGAGLAGQREAAEAVASGLRGVVRRGDAYVAHLPADGEAEESLGGRFPTARLAARAYDLSLLRRAAAATASAGGRVPERPPSGVVEQLNFPDDARCMWEVMQALHVVIQSAGPGFAPSQAATRRDSPAHAHLGGQAPLPAGPVVEGPSGAERPTGCLPSGGAGDDPAIVAALAAAAVSTSVGRRGEGDGWQAGCTGLDWTADGAPGGGGPGTHGAEGAHADPGTGRADSGEGDMQVPDRAVKLFQRLVEPRFRAAVELLKKAGAEQADCLKGPMRAVEEALITCDDWRQHALQALDAGRASHNERWARARTLAVKMGQGAGEARGRLQEVLAQAQTVQLAQRQSEADMREWLLGGCSETVYQVLSRCMGMIEMGCSSRVLMGGN
jgi:hypothetical protein